MNKKRYFFLLFLCTAWSLSSQKKEIRIYGKVVDSTTVVKNAHIINLNTNKGTFSNDQGAFRIYASLGDSLKASSIQHETAIGVITKYNISSTFFTIRLQKKRYVLDEIVLKKHYLTGILSLDRKQTPKDWRENALKNTMTLSKENMKAPVPDDHIDKRVRPPVVRTDPNQAFIGAGAKIGIPFKYSEKLWTLRRKLNYQKKIPVALLDELGETFFYVDLKIPEEKYYHFLEYCNHLGIENLYLQRKKLEVIKILKKESNAYLKILKENKEKNDKK
ncbi:MAG: hypothetical protein GKR88_11685 [Flavobacteriaceae bacterium]|nr:MAG: hypothetical protein GKR88_11685 [Flavobacteriaceae bacterium]